MQLLHPALARNRALAAFAHDDGAEIEIRLAAPADRPALERLTKRLRAA